MARKLRLKGQPLVVEVPVTVNNVTAIVAFKGISTKDFGNAINDLLDKGNEAYYEYLKTLVLYVKNAVLEVEDGNEIVETITIEDSRTVVANEFWTTPAECLDAILSEYFEWASGIQALLKAAGDAIAKVPELEAKN